MIDDNAKNVNNAAFAFGTEIPERIDVLGACHDGACGFASLMVSQNLINGKPRLQQGGLAACVDFK